MNNILFADVSFNGKAPENVMVFTNLDQAAVVAGLANRGADMTYADVFTVPDNEIKFYIFDPLWLTPAQEEEISHRNHQRHAAHGHQP